MRQASKETRFMSVKYSTCMISNVGIFATLNILHCCCCSIIGAYSIRVAIFFFLLLMLSKKNNFFPNVNFCKNCKMAGLENPKNFLLNIVLNLPPTKPLYWEIFTNIFFCTVCCRKKKKFCCVEMTHTGRMIRISARLGIPKLAHSFGLQERT